MRKYVVLILALAFSLTLIVPAFADWSLFVTSWDTQKVLRYDGLTGADKPGTFSNSVVKPGAQFAEADLSRPMSAAVAPDGLLYVCDFYGSGVRVYDSNGNGGNIALNGTFGTTQILFNGGFAYITARYMPDGTEPGTIMQYDLATSTLVNAEFARLPSGVSGYFSMAFLPNGTILSLDSAGQFIQFNSTTGAGIDRWNTPSAVDTPVMVAYHGGYVYVAGLGTTVRRFTFDPASTGSASIVLDDTWGLSGNTGSNPWGFDFGPDGNLYVAYGGDSSIRRFNIETGAYIDTFVASGQGGLSNPRKIHFYKTQTVGTLTANINLADYAMGADKVGLTVDMREGVGVSETFKVFPDDAGNISLTVSTGTFDVAIKGTSSLRKVIGGVTISTGATTDLGTVDLINGDIDGDNEVTSTDLSILGLNLGLMGDE